MARIAGAVLAAGSGSRMGTPKAELVVAGERLLDRAVRTLRDGGCDPVLAVVRAGTDVAVAVPVVNPDPDRGMRSSLAAAVAALGLPAAPADPADHPAADPAPVDALAVLLVDLPGVDAAAVRAVLAAWRPGRIAVATFGTRRGHPLVMSPELWRAALATAGPDEGARRLLRARPDLVDAVAVAGDPTDLDTPADVHDWTARRPPAAG